MATAATHTSRAHAALARIESHLDPFCAGILSAQTTMKPATRAASSGRSRHVDRRLVIQRLARFAVLEEAFTEQRYFAGASCNLSLTEPIATRQERTFLVILEVGITLRDESGCDVETDHRGSQEASAYSNAPSVVAN